MDFNQFPRHNILCIDMKSFYASIECVARNLDPLKTKLVVVGDINRNGSVVLAASPQMKKIYNIKTGSRLFEVKNIQDPDIIIAQAKMERYLETAKKITDIFLSFVPPNSLHTYSVDESWLTMNGTERLWGDVWNASRLIVEKIKNETGCIATVGIGDNKFQAKFCLDVYGKEQGIAECGYETFQELFHHLPVQEMWGIGAGITKRLNKMNIFTVGELSRAIPSDLQKEFGVIGIQLYQYASGIDFSPVYYDQNNSPTSAFGFVNDEHTSKRVKSIGRGVTLLTDYTKRDDILLVIRELLEEVCLLLRKKQMEGKTIHLTVGYSKNVNKKGFTRQYSFKNSPSNDPLHFMNRFIDIFDKNYTKGAAVRTLRVAISKLQDESTTLIEKPEQVKRKAIINTMDKLNDKYGKGTLRPAFSFTKASVADERNNKLGGHFKE